LTLSFSSPGTAGDPAKAVYSDATDRLFWFIQASDTHIGASSTAAENLQWLVTEANNVIAPSFIMVTGDLTDSTNGGLFPNGPYIAEWESYRNIVDSAGMTRDTYYDIPGNHDAYNDKYFAYYRNYSVQGRATDDMQVSFVKNFTFGNYHFLGINTADNTGAKFSIWPPYFGDHAGLDSSELAFINAELSANSGSDLTMVFGHHPLDSTGDSSDTYVYYGLPEFLSYMDAYFSSLYGYGHTHESSEARFIPTGAIHQGFFYFNVRSLGKDSPYQYTITAVDCNGVSSKTTNIKTWPAVLITAPVDVDLSGSNPYAYSVPISSSNPIRALVFDPNTPSVQYRIDGGQWSGMSNVTGNGRLWQCVWDASSLSPGRHTIEVTAASASGTSTDSIAVNLVQSQKTYLSGATIIDVGKYVTGGTKRNPTKEFRNDLPLNPGDTVVFKLKLQSMNNGGALGGGTAELNITGSVSLLLTSAISNSSGVAEATWKTSAPNKRGTGGTPTGTYNATIAGVTAAGYTWDGVPNSKGFSITPK